MNLYRLPFQTKQHYCNAKQIQPRIPTTEPNHKNFGAEDIKRSGNDYQTIPLFSASSLVATILLHIAQIVSFWSSRRRLCFEEEEEE
jgi:hypothetical protein